MNHQEVFIMKPPLMHLHQNKNCKSEALEANQMRIACDNLIDDKQIDDSRESEVDENMQEILHQSSYDACA